MEIINTQVYNRVQKSQHFKLYKINLYNQHGNADGDGAPCENDHKYWLKNVGKVMSQSEMEQLL